jgi:hypothetical protein
VAVLSLLLLLLSLLLLLLLASAHQQHERSPTQLTNSRSTMGSRECTNLHHTVKDLCTGAGVGLGACPLAVSAAAACAVGMNLSQ